MAEIINLNKARKDKAKAQAKQQAQGNRALFGQTRHAKSKLQLELEKARQALDQHKRED